jgi:Winged helix-turn helix
MLSDAAQGGVVVVPPLKALLEKKLGKSLSLTTLYNMLHRHGWHKPAPDTAHPKGDPQAREDWKKTPQRPGTNTREFCQAATAAADISGRSPLWAYQPMPTLLA